MAEMKTNEEILQDYVPRGADPHGLTDTATELDRFFNDDYEDWIREQIVYPGEWTPPPGANRRAQPIQRNIIPGTKGNQPKVWVRGFGVSGNAGLGVGVEGDLIFVEDSSGNRGWLVAAGAGAYAGFAAQFGPTWIEGVNAETVYDLEGKTFTFSKSAGWISVQAILDENGLVLATQTTFGPSNITVAATANITFAKFIPADETELYRGVEYLDPYLVF